MRNQAEINRLRGRCVIDSVTGCWLWRGAKSNDRDGGQSTRAYGVDYTKDRSGATKTTQTGLRAMWHAFSGKPIPDGHRVYHLACCTERLCINPSHITCGPTEQWGASITAAGRWRNVAARKLANQSSGKAAAAATTAQVREILTSPKTGVQLSDELGLSRSTISKIRRGKVAYARNSGASPFAGLFSRL